MPYEISSGKIPVGSVKVHELGLDPATEIAYRQHGSARALGDYMDRCAQVFLRRNPYIKHLTIVLEAVPNTITPSGIRGSPGSEPDLKIAFYTQDPRIYLSLFVIQPINREDLL